MKTRVAGVHPMCPDGRMVDGGWQKCFIMDGISILADSNNSNNSKKSIKFVKFDWLLVL